MRPPRISREGRIATKRTHHRKIDQKARVRHLLDGTSVAILADLDAVVAASSTTMASPEFVSALEALAVRLANLRRSIARLRITQHAARQAQTRAVGVLDEFDKIISSLLGASRTSDREMRFQLYGQALHHLRRARATRAAAEKALGRKWRF
jgi:hypothetical protein